MSLWKDIRDLGRDAWDNIGDYYQQVVLGVPRFPQHHHTPEQDLDGPGLGGWRHTTGFIPPKAVDGEILPPEPRGPMPPEPPPYDPLTGLRALRVEHSDTAEPKALPSPEPDRGGPDFDR